MRALLLCLPALLSCGAPMDGVPGTAGAEGTPGAPGASGAPGPMGAPGRDAVAPGSRLQPLYWKGADGSRIAAGVWRDMKTGETCGLQVASGTYWMPGATYLCIPIGRTIGPGDDATAVRFTLEP